MTWIFLLALASAGARGDDAPSLRGEVERLVAAGKSLEALNAVRAGALRFRGRDHFGSMMMTLADHFVRLGRPDLAEGCYEEARVKGRNDAEMESRIGDGYRDGGDYERAIPHFRAAQEQDHPNRYLVMLDEAYCHFASSRLEDAQAITDRMIAEKTTWGEQAVELSRILAKARAGGAAGFIDASDWLRGYSTNARPSLPHAALAYALKAAACGDATEAQKRQADSAAESARKLIADPALPRPTPWRRPDLTVWPGPCAEGHRLENEGRNEQALRAYEAYRPGEGRTGMCGTGVREEKIRHQADRARLLGKLGRRNEAIDEWAAVVQSGHDRAIYEFVRIAQGDQGLRQGVLYRVPETATGRQTVETLERLEKAIQVKGVSDVLNGPLAVPGDYLTDALVRIGKDGVPDMIEALRKGADRTQQAVDEVRLTAVVNALGVIRNPSAVRPLWKARVSTGGFPHPAMRQAIESFGEAARRELMGWLDSDDPVEFWGAVQWIPAPPDAVYWTGESR